MEQNKRLLNPKLDVVFQALFGEEGSEGITKSFLEEILEVKILKIQLNINPILRRKKQDDKLGILDVAVKINENQNCDIEMQMIKQEYIKERILFYWSKLYIRSIAKGQDYNKLEKSIIILITDKNVPGLEDMECHTKWKILETKNKQKILTDKLEIHIIQLDKLKENIKNINDNLLDWLMFLENPKSERVIKKMDENKALKEAKQKLDKLSEDGKMQQLAWWREKAVYEENTRKREEEEVRKLKIQIDEGKKQLNEGQKKLDEGQRKLDEGQMKLDEGQRKLDEDQKKLDEGQRKLDEGQMKLDEGQRKLDEDQKKLDEGQRKLDEDRKQFVEDKKRLDEEKDKFFKQIEKNKQIEIAKKMKEKKMDIEQIKEITGLTTQEIDIL